VAATASTVTATFTIAANAPVGPVSVSVTDVNGTSNTVQFTITGPIPVLTSINPITGGTGATVPVTITGTGLIGATLTLPAGVTLVPGTLVNNSFTTVTASLLIAGNAPLGAQLISVTTPGVGNTSNSLTFTVFALAPLLNTIAPTTAAAGSTVTVTLNGQGFTGTTSVNTLAGGGIVVSSFTVNSGAQITATFVIGLDAITQGISVTNPSGTSNSVTFGIVPTLASINPATGVAGTSVPVTLTGTSFIGATAINTGTAGITVQNLVVVNSTQITATFAIAAGATQGIHSIAVVTPGGTTAQAVTFNVLPPAPVITSLNNTSISKASRNVGMNVNGSNLGNLGIGSVQVLLNGVPAGANVSMSNFQPSQTQIRFNWTFLGVISGPGNAYTITVTTPSGTSNAFPFTVTN
jgi:large repetitive protein